MKKKIAIFPGSFDPITVGHVDIILRGLPLFDELIVAIGQNSEKNYMFPIQERKKWIENTFSEYKNIKVAIYEGLTIEFCKEVNSHYILRGLRNPADFEFEKSIANINRDLSSMEIETVFLLTSASKSYISSSNVREVIRNHGDYTKFVPASVRL